MLSHANRLGGMPRTYLIFGNIEGKLDVLRVECTRCGRKGRYSVAKLIAKHGRTWREMLNADCPKRDAHSLQDRCDVVPRSAEGIVRRTVRTETDLECGRPITT
jgi:hypothetical protein